MEDRRRESVLPSSPEMVSDLRLATEAMQRAADAMVMATESFRRELQSQDATSVVALTQAGPGPRVEPPLPRTPRESFESARDSSSLRLPFETPAGSSVSLPLGEPRAAKGPGGPGQSSTEPLPIAGPVGVVQHGASHPGRQDWASDKADGTYFGADGVYNTRPPLPAQNTHSTTQTGDWPAGTGSTPTLAPAHVAPASPARAGRGHLYRNLAAHADLARAAQRNKAHGRYTSRDRYTRWDPTVVMSSAEGRPRAGGEPPEPAKLGGDAGGHITVSSLTSSLTDGSSGTQPQQAGPPPRASHSRPEGFSPTHEVFFVGIICLAQVLMLAGIGQALSPASVIGRTFPDTTPGALAWYSAAYGLTAGTFVLPAGRLGDLFGHKRIFVIGFLWFAAWSLVVGFAGMVQSAGGRGTVFFCLTRAMQGIGPALLVPNGQAMLGRAYRPGRRKNLVMSLFGAAAPLGFVAGAVMSSLFSVKASWPWAFWTMAIVCTGLAFLSAFVLPPTRRAGGRGLEGLWAQLDGTGALLGVSGLVLLNFAFNQAPLVSWSTPYTYFILIISLMLLVGFVYVELLAPHPLVPVAAMRSHTNFVLGCTGAGWACFSIWVYYSFSLLEGPRGWPPLLASAAYAPGPVSGLAASLLTGFLMGKIRPHWIMLISMCAFSAGSILMVTAPVGQIYWLNTFFSILIMPFGMDMSNPAATILLSNSVSKEHQGIAASLVVTVVNYSISISLGIAGTVETHVNKGGSDVLAGYRGAQFFGLGLGGLGTVLAALFLIQSCTRVTARPKT